MLLNYTVSNFKSIADAVEFKMVPNPQEIDSKYYNMVKQGETEIKVLKRAVCYGANASGKTSFVESITFAKKFILNPLKTNGRIPVNQFKGFENDTSLFQFTFFLKGNIYEYGFSLDRDKVHEEWLMLIEENSEHSILERVTDESNETTIHIGSPSLFNQKESNIIEIMKNSIKTAQRNQLFLSKLNENGVSLAEDIIQWFENIVIIFPDSSLEGLEFRIDQDEDFSNFLSQCLDEFDTGVKHVELKEEEGVPLQKLLEQMGAPKKVIDEVTQDILDKKVGLIEINGRTFKFGEDADNLEPFLHELQLVHQLRKKTVPFSKADESDGTKRLLDLLPILYKMSDQPRIVIIDELDRSFHTLITKEFLKRFLAHSQGLNNQLIATMHDVNTIDLNEMSNQEIWFFNKNNVGETSIKPLSDYALADGYSVDFAYLAGRFGGIPNIKGGF